MSAAPASLAEGAAAVLGVADAPAKAAACRALAKAWSAGALADIGRAPAPARPGRPDRPVLKPPRAVAKRRITQAPAGRFALLHALAHIELNAIDLALDIVIRFPDAGLPRAFFDDWIGVADDEARHFLMLRDRLGALGGDYGDLPAHDGLWQAAADTADDVKARLAIVPLVLEARGLDVTPAMIDKLAAAGDRESAAALRVIHDDEIGHVAVGKRWFDWACARERLEPRATWRALVRARFAGRVKPPFNTASRDKAGLPAAFYADLDAA